jgi:predicted Zn-dependent protease
MLKFILFTVLVGVEAIIKFDVIRFTNQQERVLNQTLVEINRYAEIALDRDSPYKIENKDMPDTIGVTVKSYMNGHMVDMNVYVDVSRIVYSNSLYNVLLHELGHVLGLQHNNVPNSIMNVSIPMKNNKARPMKRSRLSRYDIQMLLC